MPAASSINTTLKISAGIPATFDAAGYAALTFTTIGEITDIGEFGREYKPVTYVPLATGGTRKLKGSFDEGSIAAQLALDTDDAGQILAKTALASTADFSFVVTTQNGDKYYFQGKTMSFKVNVGNAEGYTAGSIALELTTTAAGVGIVEVLAA
jgi:hypothetical protein